VILIRKPVFHHRFVS